MADSRGRTRKRCLPRPYDAHNPANWTAPLLCEKLQNMGIWTPSSMSKTLLKQLYLENVKHANNPDNVIVNQDRPDVTVGTNDGVTDNVTNGIPAADGRPAISDAVDISTTARNRFDDERNRSDSALKPHFFRTRRHHRNKPNHRHHWRLHRFRRFQAQAVSDSALQPLFLLTRRNRHLHVPKHRRQGALVVPIWRRPCLSFHQRNKTVYNGPFCSSTKRFKV